MKEVYTGVMALTQDDKKWLKEEMYDLLVDFHENVAKPTMEHLIKHSEKRVKSGLNESLGAKIDVVDLKLTKILDHHSEKLDDHEEQIERLEEAIAA